ncbi:stage III sporulation protein AF [Lentibacillus saliphilus]|uniref:stage III sporulation protein AF n=1 Tax=Lentibacillus saliphilus TaxID=2737028 RepID=UPI001C3026E8
MEAIIQWVTQIIIFILLATIVDLIIPQTALKKYINLVVGLILILIFLKPVFYLFNVDIERALSQSYRALQENELEQAETEKWIEFQKIDIQASQDAYILEQMTAKLIELADPPLYQQLNLEIVDIDYDFKKGEDMTLENLQILTVYVQSSDRREGRVQRVEEVVIDTDGKKTHKAEDMPRDEIIDILKETWEVEADRLAIEWGGGTH